MKTRFLMLLAALLLGSASAFAQSGNNEPLKGDVNGDGKVDVADITAVIKIMKDGGGTSEETKCYYYVGTEKPTSLSQASVVESYPAEQTFTNPSTTEKCYVYVLTKADMTVNFYDPSDLTTAATKTEDTSSISGYKITNMNVRVGKGGSIKIKISPQTTYYYYAGWTLPTVSNVDNIINETYPADYEVSNSNTAGKKTTSKSSMDYLINTLYNTNEKTYYYVLVPTGHSIYDSLNNNVSNSAFTSQGNITVGNQIHTIYKSTATSRYINAIIIK